MRTLAVLFLLAFGGKKDKPSPAPAPVPEPAPVAAPAPEPEPEPEPVATEAVRPPLERPRNADFIGAVTFMDGAVRKGKVVRVERSEDWYAEDGWTDSAMKMTVTLEGGGTEVEVPWSDIRQVDVTYGSKTDVDCSYDSAYTPAMYICTLRTTTKVKTKDGKTWDAASRHKWRFIFESGDVEDFWISKLPARKQETEVPELGTNEENTKIYVELQDQLASDRTGHVVKSITITVP